MSLLKTNTKLMERLENSPSGGEVYYDSISDMTITQYRDHEVHHTCRRSKQNSKLPFAYSKHQGFNYD